MSKFLDLFKKYPKGYRIEKTKVNKALIAKNSNQYQVLRKNPTQT